MRKLLELVPVVGNQKMLALEKPMVRCVLQRLPAALAYRPGADKHIRIKINVIDERQRYNVDTGPNIFAVFSNNMNRDLLEIKIARLEIRHNWYIDNNISLDLFIFFHDNICHDTKAAAPFDD